MGRPRPSSWNGGGKHGVFDHAQRDNNHPKLHMTQKPIRLMRELVTLFTDEGETVLDPFMGSGTTLLAAIQLGRKAIGIEIDPEYFDKASRRIKDFYAQENLFIPSPPPMTQEALL